MAAIYEGDAGPSRADMMEAELHHQTVRLLDERARIHTDHHFLQHFAQAAEHSLLEQRNEAEANTQALNNCAASNQQVEEQLRRVEWEIANAQAKLRSERQTEANIKASVAELQRSTASRTAQLRDVMATEERGYIEVSKRAASCRQVLEATRRELVEKTREAQKEQRRAEEAEAALEQVHQQTREREELVQKVLQETLKRLEADFARERAEHDAVVHSMSRRQESQAPKQSQAPANTAIFEDMTDKAPPPLRSSPSAPLYVRSDAAEKAYNAAVDGVADATSAMETSSMGFLQGVRNGLGLQTAAPSVMPNVSTTPFGTDPAGLPVEESALEMQVADLRKRQEALEALWADGAWKQRGTLVEDHIASLASRAARSPPAADLADASAAATGAATGAKGAGSLPRPLVANGLLYV